MLMPSIGYRLDYDICELTNYAPYLLLMDMIDGLVQERRSPLLMQLS